MPSPANEAPERTRQADAGPRDGCTQHANLGHLLLRSPHQRIRDASRLDARRRQSAGAPAGTPNTSVLPSPAQGVVVRRLVVLASCVSAVVAGPLVAAQAGPAASFTKTVTFTDATPDPSAFLLGPEHCMGRLPAEDPVKVSIPGPGTVSVAISGFTGEWSLMVTNAKGAVIAVADADAPATESLTLKVKRAGEINILPCNIAGTFEATLTYGYAFKK